MNSQGSVGYYFFWGIIFPLVTGAVVYTAVSMASSKVSASSQAVLSYPPSSQTHAPSRVGNIGITDWGVATVERDSVKLTSQLRVEMTNSTPDKCDGFLSLFAIGVNESKAFVNFFPVTIQANSKLKTTFPLVFSEKTWSAARHFELKWESSRLDEPAYSK